MDLWLWLLAAVLVAVIAALVYEKNYYSRLYWNWDDGGMDAPHGPGRNVINTDIVSIDEEGNVVPNLEFELLPGGPNERFFWGTCTAAHQIEGKMNNQWTDWENTNEEPPAGQPDKEMPPHTKDRSGDACDHYRLFDHDAQLVKDLGCNAYRFSMEWSRLEPAPEEWNKDEFRHYHRELDALEKRGIVPMVTLHHFTEPKWFAEKGGFMDEKNIDYFVRFASMMLKEFGRRVQYWCTINEPEVYVAGGYVNGIFPPGIKNSPRAGLVLRNLLMAHVKVYYQMKSLPDGGRTQIGIVKDIFQFDPANPLNPLDHFVANKLDAVFNESILEFFRSGHFVYQMPGTDPITYFDGKAPGSNDFVGLNYYSHYLVKFVPNPKQPFSLCHPPGHILTDMPYTIYPEGLYRALHRMQRLEKPIFITENGIADSRDDRRQLYIRRYLYAVHRAMKEGVNVRGYFYWSLLDNFEWVEGFTMKFGLYETNFDNQTRRLRAGSEFYKQVVQHFTGVKPFRPDAGLISPPGVSRLFPPSMRLHPNTKKVV